MQIHKTLNELAYEESAQLKLVSFHPAVLKENPHKYYKYIGSFSAPPCTENVTYLIVGKVKIHHSSLYDRSSNFFCV